MDSPGKEEMGWFEGTAELLVGRTGAEGAMLLLESPPRQVAPVAHVRPDWQQPPPKLDGQEIQLAGQVRDADGAEDGVVGTTTTAVEVEELRVAEVGGWTKVTDVPAMTPAQMSALFVRNRGQNKHSHPTS